MFTIMIASDGSIMKICQYMGFGCYMRRAESFFAKRGEKNKQLCYN